MRGCKENGVTYSFKSQNNVLEFTAMFKAGYPNFNIRKNACG